MAANQFRDIWYASAPGWLRTGDAEKYMYTFETLRDVLMEKASQAVAIRMPGRGDPSQIPYLAFDRDLRQGPLESTLSFVTRLAGAFETWAHAGSAPAVLGQLQAYLQGKQPGTTGYELAIVSAARTKLDATKVNAWWTLQVTDVIGVEPLLSIVPENYSWPAAPWWCWLVLYQHTVLTGQSGSSAATSTASGECLADPGHNVGGVWVPRTTGTAINTPFLTVIGLTGLTSANVGDFLTMTGSVNPDNWGTFQIVQVLSPTACVIVSPDGVPLDAGPLAWSIKRYPWIPPGLAWGSPGTVWGEGESSPPEIDLGANVSGIWKPTNLPSAGTTPTYAWGLRISALEIDSIRDLVKTWKSAGTYYPNIIVSYGVGDFDRTSTGAGNPDATFETFGSNVAGVWAPTRELNSQYDGYCQGTGRAIACAVENIT